MAATAIWAFIAAVLLALGTYLCLPLDNWQKSDLPTYFGTAWSVQATVVALVYPLVISFVTFLLQRRATAKVALTAYLLETGVKPSGTSSFALLLLMTLQYLALPWMSIPEVQAVMVADVTWLAVNLFLTGWFLARTAQYLQDERCVETLQWLTQCVTLPREVRAYAMGLLLQNAQGRGWVPGGDSLSESVTPKINLFPMGEGRAVLQRKFSNPKEIRDVHFKPLGWAIGRWTRAQKTAQGKYPLMELPCTPGKVRVKHILTRIRDAAPPSRTTTAAILVSYHFAKPTVSAMPFTSVEVMDELGQEAAAQVELRREPGFRQALNDLVDVHAGLLRAARFRGSDGELDNMSLLPDPYGWGSRRMVQTWMEPYRAIAEAAVAALEDDDRFFQRTARLSERLMYRAGEQPADVLIALMLSSTLLMYHLGLWWSRRAATELVQESQIPRLLSPPLRNVYCDALQGWVGSWESVDVRINNDEVLHGAALWRAHVTRVKVYATHIDETALMLLAAVARGDAEAARRLEDSLVKWWGERQYEFGAGRGVSQPGWSLLTLSFADLTWDEARTRIPDLPEGSQTGEAATLLLATVLKRYWSDVCMVVAFVLLEHAASLESAESFLCLEIVGALMGGRGYDKGGRVDVDRHRGAGTGVGRIARALFGDRSYSQRLDKIVERYRSDTREPMTPGRTYSLHGADDVDALTRGQAIYLTALIAGRHEDLSAFTRIVEEWREELQRLDRVSRHFQALANELCQDEFKQHSTTIAKLREVLECQEPVNDALNHAASLCKEASKAAKEAHAKTVADAPLDPERLVELTQKVHARVFGSDEQSDFPIAVTTDFVATDEILETASQSFSGVSKLPLTRLQLENMDEHLVDWFSQYTARHAFAVALAGIQRKRGIEPVRDDNAQAFYADLEARMSSIIASGWTPVVLVVAGRRADYLSPYRLPEDGDVPAGFVIRPPDHPERGLHATVNGVEVYSVPMSSSRYLVLPKEWLSTLRYQRRQGDVGLSLLSKNEAAGKLDITFEFGCEFVVPHAD
ncbi:hypothetical protein [Hydrogenophaga sp. OTU3427]|uniref:hypothetical protein n=1 Tax=Hydrogenophaga sp. OTU3427 TaxID=3043856 RepID=UPI00313BA537